MLSPQELPLSLLGSSRDIDPTMQPHQHPCYHQYFCVYRLYALKFIMFDCIDCSSTVHYVSAAYNGLTSTSYTSRYRRCENCECSDPSSCPCASELELASKVKLESLSGSYEETN